MRWGPKRDKLIFKFCFNRRIIFYELSSQNLIYFSYHIEMLGGVSLTPAHGFAVSRLLFQHFFFSSQQWSFGSGCEMSKNEEEAKVII